ncbi:MAG: 50S ribosomal protein L11 methyltransferase [Bacteroidota bacterium]
MKDTIEVILNFAGDNTDESKEILIAEMSTLPYHTFQEETNKLLAYIDSDKFDEEQLKSLYSLQHHPDTIQYSYQNIKEKNWNEEWEKNFDPIVVEDKCVIYAPFHKNRPQAQYEIEIMPKMSFGTGHHATTYLMIQYMFRMDFTNKKVLDMGCGTAVLAILAEKLKAAHCIAIDNDDWAYQNAKENVILNDCERTQVQLGNVESLQGLTVDVILANINRNVLLEDIPVYVSALKPGGELLLSGILKEDFEKIYAKALQSGLDFHGKLERNNWNAALFSKK